MATAYSTYDYDGYRPNKTGGSQYTWIAPSGGQLRDYDLTGRDGKQYASLKDLSTASGLEKHGVEIDYDIFNNLQPPNPSTPHAVYHATDLDFTLNPKGNAVDKGVLLPNVNDGYNGAAPDLGAIEAGDPRPGYGARGAGKGSFYR
jgi:hypothetical protein